MHLCSSYLLELQNGLSKERAILKSSSEVGLACWYTSVTTFFGFVALAFVPTPVFSATWYYPWFRGGDCAFIGDDAGTNILLLYAKEARSPSVSFPKHYWWEAY